jgi:eukaryotic-like serine/threonine-protein kinase
MIGKILAHYEITSQLGKGGMGEVYQAKDRKLGRDVAIKVLPEEFAKDADRVARFQREAKILASLNHPNIAAIFGLEESGGTNFLVLELVEGDTLADRIKAGPIPVEESLKLALQVAEALEAAHDKGIIHRDLKPANIKVAPDGKVKVLDFGLAKAFAVEQSELNLSNSPTLSDAATQQGIILGTAAYMSPEQAKGKTVDKRADVWAFGIVLFEMLTGRQLFSGETISETLAAVLMREPDFSKLPQNLHPKSIQALKRCLIKETRNRYGSINDARIDIQEALADPNGLLAQPMTPTLPRTRLRTMLPWFAAAVILTAIIAGLAAWILKPIEPRQVMRFQYELPEGQQFSTLVIPNLAISPDGKRLVYGTAKGLYLRSVDELAPKLISGTEGSASEPFFSPDGKWVGYYSVPDRKLKKIAVNGGAPVALSDVATLVGASWSEDDTIVYGQIPGDIMKISANGGTPEPVVKMKSKPLILPQILPDGKSILYTAAASTSQFSIVVQPIKSGEPIELFTGTSARYLPTGHIVYAVGNNLLAVPFDPSKLETAGGSVPVVEGIYRTSIPAISQYAISDSGTMVYVPGTDTVSSTVQRTLVWVDRKGKEQPLAAQPNDYRAPHISPDGTKLALAITAGNKSDIWIWDLLRETMTRLTFNESSNGPLWTLDGQRVVFMTGSDPGNLSVFWKATDGTGGDEKIGSALGRIVVMPESWSGDGKILVTGEWNGATGLDIGSLSMEGDHKWRPLLQDKYDEGLPIISHDGRWIAYASNESGKYEIYARPFPDLSKGKWQVSTSGGNSPLWSLDGREIFYRNGDSVMAVAVDGGQTFKCGKPEPLFRGTYTSSNAQDLRPWDVNPDGKRFLMMKDNTTTGKPAETPRKINIVVNWFEELKQRVPGK